MLNMLDEACEVLDAARRKRNLVYEEIPTRVDMELENLGITELDMGHAIMDKIRSYLEMFDTEKKYRGSNQIMIQQKMCGAVCAMVYGPNLVRKYERVIKEYNNVKSLKQQIFYSAPRRGGKTEALSQWGAAIMMAVPNADVCIFSASRRASGKQGLMGRIQRDLYTLGIKKTEDVTKDNDEDFFIKINGSERKVHGYPAAVASFVKCKLFMRVIYPSNRGL